MIDIFKNSSDERKWYVNFAFCLFALIGSLFLPTLFHLFFNLFIKSAKICTILSYIMSIVILVLMYYKDLINEAKIFKKNANSCLSIGFKYYVIGLLAMVFFNLVISNILKNISANESQVRELLFDNPLYMLLSISIFAPIEEELIYRKSIRPLVKNGFLYAILCGLAFGLAHLTTNFLDGSFVISDLLYILPYGSLGFVFAYMDFESKNTYTSMIMHSIHNTITALLLLLMNFSGVL